MDKKMAAEIARAYFKSKNVYRYRTKRVIDMSDVEVVEKCHWWYTENNLIEDYMVFEDAFVNRCKYVYDKENEDMVELREITKENIDDVLKLSVAKHQENFVSTTAESLAQAYVYKENAFPFAVYFGELLVGFVMLGYYEVKNQYTLWKLLIDEKYQNNGYGKCAVKLAIKYLIDKFNVGEVYVGVAFGNDIARDLYYSMGFRETGEKDKVQLEMRLEISRE